jgi:hypothetical protein
VYPACMPGRPFLAVFVSLVWLSAAAARQRVEAPPAAGGFSGAVDDVRRLEVDSHDARFEALTALLRERSVPFTVEPFTIAQRGAEPRTEGRNIVVTLGQRPSGGGAPREDNDDTIIAAHYDAFHFKDGSFSRGAVDNGASSVILVRLADALRRQPPGRSRVRLIFFDLEEAGLGGSARYVEAHGIAGIRHVINLDINGYGDTVLYGDLKSAQNVALRQSLVETCAAKDIPCLGLAEMPAGDDRSFTRAGAGAVISMGILPGVEAHQLWLLLQGGKESGLVPGTLPVILRTIHTTEDRSDKLDPRAMERVFDLALALVRRLAP